jgi:hypothetical protein
MAELFKGNLSLEKILALGSSIANKSVQYDMGFDEHYFQQALIESCHD